MEEIPDPISKQLDDIYYDPADAGAYGGINKLYQAVKRKGLQGINKKLIEKYLKDQQSYSVHKPARKNFARNKTIVSGIDDQWQADLADMQSISKENDGFKYILTVIDIFSKFAWAIPVKTKGSKDMVVAFESLFEKSNPRTPTKLQTDDGKEFLNKDVQKLIKIKGINFFTTKSDKKAAVVERFNRTLKSKIWRYFTAHQTNKYIDILDDMVSSYNRSYHRSIGCRPIDVNKHNEVRIWARLYGNGGGNVQTKLDLGQKVRLSKVKGRFEKGYLPNWTAEHFVVDKVVPKGRGLYKVKDYDGEDIKGSFYPEEVQAINENRFLIEKILNRRSRKGVKEIFVKWQGWPTKFNSWIPETNIEPIIQSKRK